MTDYDNLDDLDDDEVRTRYRASILTGTIAIGCVIGIALIAIAIVAIGYHNIHTAVRP